MCIKKDPDVAKSLGATVRKLTIIIGEVATSLEKIAEVPVTDWMAIGDAIVNKVERMNLPKQPSFVNFIPKIRDFKNIKMLGAGGFGAVYLANYRPANFIATVKLVAMDRFQRHKQAAMDKVVASVIRNPFLVKYYSCFCVKEAYVTIMEYIAGLDLMHVVTKEAYLEIDAVQIIMAQLILAVEHMHLRGFLHRDIKVSNILILPGGRIKVIDFDTTKVCNGHFTKHPLRGYFRRTPFEFHDGESAGTIPYMAPEILKRRPYGRSADWWSVGIVMYKLMTGRVPFRGKTKQMLRERIITAPLKWPRVEEHKHSATTPAKDMTYRMLKKNPVERLGSVNYNELKTHPFFDRFNWRVLYTNTDLCDIPSIAEILKSNAEKGGKGGDPEDKRRHQRIEEMIDVTNETQKPLLCYSSSSFKKLMTKVKRSKTAIKVSETFMETSDITSSGIKYEANTQGAPSSKGGTMTGSDGKNSQTLGPEKIELIVTRKKKFFVYGSFGFTVQRAKGEEGANFIYVEAVENQSPAQRAQVLPLDVILAVNGVSLADASVDKVNKLVASSADKIVLSVMTSSSYRVLTTQRDALSLVRNAQKETVVLSSAPTSHGGNRPCGLGILDVNVMDDKNKQRVRLFVLTHANVTSKNMKMVYPGDVVTHVDGTSLDVLSRDQVLQLLSTAKKEVTLTVVPLSPMRAKRIIISKFHETAMTDTNVASKSTGANIETS
ncbi:microtubule-associated serine/threonine-protein kinase 3-like [Ixodes scapularis]